MDSNFLFLTRRQWIAATLFALMTAIANCPRDALAESPYAVELIAQNGAYGGASLYNDPNAVLGEPTRLASNSDPLAGTSPFHTKLVEPAYNVDLSGNKVITTLSRKSNGVGGFTYGSITVKFDHPVIDEPTNPYGIDLNVFGNAFYIGNGFVSDASDMRTYNLVGGIFAEPVVISVSPDNANWYTYANGPYGDTAFPTQGYAWSGTQHDTTGKGWTDQQTDFAKPVNPTLSAVLGAAGNQMPALDAISTYVGAGGGTGIDLSPSGFTSIQYVRFDSTTQFRDGEIDGISDVRPMRIGEALSITPANVVNQTSLYFQNQNNVVQTDVLATFSAVSGLARLDTGNVTAPEALSALSNRRVFATYDIEVGPLIGLAEIEFSADYGLSSGSEYTGKGDGLTVVRWNNGAWLPVPFSYDPAARRAIVDDWTNSSGQFALVGLTGDFNLDGRVDAADYPVLRNGLGARYSENDFQVWRANFGAVLGAGSGLPSSLPVVPEPCAVTLMFAAVVAGLVCRVSR